MISESQLSRRLNQQDLDADEATYLLDRWAEDKYQDDKDQELEDQNNEHQNVDPSA